MNNSSFLALIQNASLLLALAVVFDTTARHWRVGEKVWKQIFLGLLLGGIGIMLINTPWIYGEGLIFDTRSILLSISGLFFGAIPTLIAMAMTAFYRFTQGGAYLTGISVIIATGLLGIIWRKRRRKLLEDIEWWQLYLFGIVTHIVMLALMFTQPIEIALPLVSRISLPIMVIYPAGTVLLGLLLLNRLRREKAIEEIQKNQSRLKSMVDILQNPAENTQTFLDFALEEAIKITESKIGFIYFYSEETQLLTLNTWSKGVMEICSISNQRNVWDLESIGIWGEAIRQRQSLIVNDYQAKNPKKKGYPEGHAEIRRLLVIPVFSENQIVAVVGVANKEMEYDEKDSSQLSLLMEMVWKTTDRKNAIEALRVSEENYRLLFDQAADGIFITTQNGEFLNVNESGCLMLGYTREELRTGFREILRNEDEPYSFEKAGSIFQIGQKKLSERKLRTKTGDLIDVEILTLVLPDGRVQKVVRNITERKRGEELILKTQKELQDLLEISDDSRKALLSVVEDQKIIEEALRNSEKSYRNLFENITQGFALHKVILDEKGVPVDYQFLAVNPAYEKMTGLLVEKIIGKSVLEILPNLEKRWIEIYGEVALSGKPKQFEDYTATIGKFYDITAFCPEPGYFAVIVSDVSERRKYEMEIQNFNLELENRVKTRTAELETANRELESFSYSISHDLRAPLRSINGFSQIILEEHADQFNPEVSRYFELIRKNASMMGNLVDDLLDFSRLGKQEIKKERIDPTIVVNEVIESNQTEISERKIIIEIDDLPKCRADPSLVRQIYANLIANSVKFTRTQADPRIEIGYFQGSQNKKDQTPCYFVKDNGVGFDMKFYDKLFRVFHRLHRAEDYEGTGVGLAIVDRIVKKHGGKIWAESVEGQGATFYFTLGEPKNG